MSTSKKDPSSTIHFLSALTVHVPNGSRFGRGRVMTFGEELPITDELRRLNTDRHGNCWLDLVDDEPAQEARWGCVMFRRGPWPSDRLRFAPGSFEWEDARERARQKAWREDDPARRAELLRAVKEEYGPAPTSRTIGVLRGDHG